MVNSIGNALKQLRTDRKLTQKQVADALGIARVNYTPYENNTSCPDYDTLVMIANFYEVSLDYLLGRDNFY